MTTRAEIDDFLKQKSIAMFGVSRNSNKFGSNCYKELKRKGYKLFPIHPEVETIQGERCYASLSALPDTVGGIFLSIPPLETEKVVKEIASSGIKRVWMQKGAESEKAIDFCKANGISLVHGECILMYAEPLVFFHKAHRFFHKLLGKMPK